MKIKSFVVLVLALVAAFPAFSQIAGTRHTADVKAEADFITLSQLPVDASIFRKPMPEEEDENMEHDNPIPPGSVIWYQDSNATGINHIQGITPSSPAPTTNFQGLLDNVSTIPPDVGGAAGPSHLMVTHNSEIRIMSKTGSVTSTVSLNSFWSSLGGSISAFDPKALYDPYSSRWVVVACGNSGSASSCLLVAVSQTNNPTGSWNFYKIDADATDVNWFDYPSLGFNKNWIVISGNMFTNSGNNFTSGNIWVLDKANFYSGGAGNYTAISSGSNGFTICPAHTFDNTISTQYLLQTWNGSSGGSGYLNLYTITGSIGSEVLTHISYPSTANPWSYNQPGGADSGPQSGASQKVDLGDDRMQNVIYRNGYVWGAHTVFLPSTGSTRSAAQWWQINTTGSSVTQCSRVDDATGVKFYAYPSISVNSRNDALMGYSSFSSTQFPSANYSFRYSCETTNTMQSDYLYKAGQAKYYKTYSGSKNRWGDYTATCIDPTNDLDFWTLQEYASTPTTISSTTYDRWATWWANVVAPTDGGTGTWTWTGAMNTDWFNRCNWDKNSLPDLSSDVVIPGPLTYYPIITGGTANCNSISINYTSGASVTVDIPNGGYLNSTN